MRRMNAPIGIRVRRSERELIEAAAEKMDCTMSEMIRRAAVARARKIIREAEEAAKT